MKKIVLAALLATTVTLAPWQAMAGGDFLHGQRLYSLGDYAGALSTWRPLAQEGDARAQYSMAVLYLKGRGVEQDRAKAREWTGRAAKQGYKPAGRLLEKLRQKAPGKRTAAKPKLRKSRSQMTELERVEASVEDLLKQITGKIAKEGALRYGDLQAVQLADAIQVTIPDIVIHADDGGIFDIGTVVARVERWNARYDDITLALPGEIRFRKADGSNGRITMAERLAKLRWDRELQTSTEFEFRLGRLVFLLENGDEMGRLGELLVQAEVIEDKGLWSGPMRFAMTKLNMTEGVESALQIGRFSLVLDLRGLDLPAINSNMGNVRAGTGDTPPLQQLLGLAHGVGLRIKVENFVARHPDRGEFRLGKAEYGVNISSADGKLLNLVLTTNHHGLVGRGAAAANGMLPSDLDIALTLENIPIETLVGVGAAAVFEVALLGKLSSGPQVFERLRKDLSAAATALRLKRANIMARDYNIQMEFTLLADRAAKAGVVGGGDLRIRGLQKLLAVMGPAGAGPAADGQGRLPLAAMIGKGRSIDGGAGRLFSLAVRPDGMLTVNGDPVISLAPYGE